MISPFTSLIEHQGLGVVCFDGRLRIVDLNTTATEMLAIEGALHPKSDLEELFPELVGIQDQLERIIDQHDAAYRLDNVNRRDGHGQIRYWNLLLLAGPEVGRGMLIIDDVTEKAMAIQVVNQQRYDRYLYRQSIDHRRNQIGTWFKGQSTVIKRDHLPMRWAPNPACWRKRTAEP